MRILMVSGTFPPRKFGGITAVTYILSRKLVQQGHHVSVYTTDVGDNRNTRLDVNKKEKLDGIDVHYFKNVNNKIAFDHRLYLPVGFASEIKKDIKNYDVVHIHDLRSYLCVVTCYFAQKYGVPYIIQPHGDIPYLFEGSPPIEKKKMVLKKIYDNSIGIRILLNASVLVALTEVEKEQFRRLVGSDATVKMIPNGIDLTEYSHLPPKGMFKREYHLKADDKIILFLGRINKIKGVDFLIESFSQLRKEIPNVKLVITGPDDGYLEQAQEIITKKNINESTIFTGPLYGEKKLEAYIDADIFVLPSRYETFPNTVLEASACKTPVIMTNTCGISKLFDSQDCVVPFGDIHLLKEKIKKLLQTEDLKIQYGNENYIRIINEYNWDNVVKLIENLYQSTIGGNE